MISFMNQKRKGRKGQGLVEYALMLVLISIVVMAVLQGIGWSVESNLDDVRAGLAAAGAGGCWVAAELFGGWEMPKTVAARYYVNYVGPRWFKNTYLKYGEGFASFLHRNPTFKPLVRPLFEYFAREGHSAMSAHRREHRSTITAAAPGLTAQPPYISHA